MPEVFPGSPQSSGLLFQAGMGGMSAAQRKLRLSEAESGVFPILTGKKRPKIRDPSYLIHIPTMLQPSQP